MRYVTHKYHDLTARHSELYVQPQHFHEDLAAILVVTGMVEVLESATRRHASPQVCRVIGLDDVLATVPQPAVAEEESETAEGEIVAVQC
jgi:hypothetical protein